MHKLTVAGTFFVTVGTYLKLHHFRGKARLGVLHRGLLKVAKDYGWALEAWAVFSNHYHFVGHSPGGPEGAATLPHMLSHLHQQTAAWINRLDGETERQVWHNYRDTLLTYQRSYFARLNYVHRNAVKHGLVKVASQYPWCSAAWFERAATAAQVATIYAMNVDRVNVYDEYETCSYW